MQRQNHMTIRYMFIRKDIVAQNRLKESYIPGEEQPADHLTKQLPI